MQGLRYVVPVFIVAACSAPLLTLNRTTLRMTHPRTVAAPRFAGRGYGGATLTYSSFGCDGEAALAGVQDPAPQIRAAVTAALAKRFSLEVIEGGSPDLVLEIRTTFWAPIYTGTQWVPGTSVLYYDGSLKLTDKRTNTVLAEGACLSHPVVGVKGPLREEDFREAVSSAVDYCTDDFRHRLLGLY